MAPVPMAIHKSHVGIRPGKLILGTLVATMVGLPGFIIFAFWVNERNPFIVPIFFASLALIFAINRLKKMIL